jgi:predicted nucleic acid-binding protein
MPLSERSSKEAVERRAFDLMIACTAIEYGATLVTHDGALKDGTIGELIAEDWLESAP